MPAAGSGTNFVHHRFRSRLGNNACPVNIMWYLIEDKPERPPAPRHWLGGVDIPQGRTIGRKHVDIRLQASSVSRNHARLIVKKSPFYAHPHPHRRTTTVTVIDSSAYGTFLKYPKGHPSARNATAHHIRLDKNSPFEIFNGALLSFGAPAAWWRLVSHPLLIIPCRLSETERKRLTTIATVTGLDIADSWAPNATHLVTNTCSTRSAKLLSALAARIDVVPPSWVEGLHHVVTTACRAIVDAPNNDAATVTTSLPEPLNFNPPFEANDICLYGPTVVKGVFDPERMHRRENLFRNIVFAFACEKRRSYWTTIVELCAGRVALAAATRDPNSSSAHPCNSSNAHIRETVDSATHPDARVLCIRNDAAPIDSDDKRPFYDERVLISALLAADVNVFDAADSQVHIASKDQIAAIPNNDGTDDSAHSSTSKPAPIGRSRNAGGRDPSQSNNALDGSEKRGHGEAALGSENDQPSHGWKRRRLNDKITKNSRQRDSTLQATASTAHQKPAQGESTPSRLMDVNNRLKRKKPASPSADAADENVPDIVSHDVPSAEKPQSGHRSTRQSRLRESQNLQHALDDGSAGAVEGVGEDVGMEGCQDDLEGEDGLVRSAEMITMQEDEHGWQERVSTVQASRKRGANGGEYHAIAYSAVPEVRGNERSSSPVNPNDGGHGSGDVRTFQGTTVSTAGRISSSLRPTDEMPALEVESSE